MFIFARIECIYNVATISIRNQPINAQIIKCIPIFDYLVIIFGIEDELVIKM